MDRDAFTRDRPTWLMQAQKLAPLYRVVGVGEPGPAGWGSGGRTKASTRQSDDDGAVLEIEVSSSERPPLPSFGEYLLFQKWLAVAVPHQVSFPITLTADRWESTVRVDGTEHPFVFVGDATRWVAGGVLPDGRTVEIAGQNLPATGLALESLDPRTLAS